MKKVAMFSDINNNRPLIFASLFLMMGFIVLVSYFFYLNEGLRLDEAQSLYQTAKNPQALIHLVAKDVHVPLYHLALHFWQFFFGYSIEAGRLMSLLFFLLTVPAMYLLGSFLHNRMTGLFASLLLAVSPFMHWFGNEIRMYSLLALLTVLNQYFFLRIFKSPSRNMWIGYFLTALLAVYTHYFFFFAILAQAVFLIMNKKYLKAGIFKAFLLVGGVVSASVLPWVYYVYSLGGASEMRPAILPPTSIDLFNTFSHFVFGFQSDALNTLLLSLWPLAVLFIFFALRRDQKITPEIKFLLTAVLVPIVALFLLSFVYRPLYLTRYLIITLPAFYLFIVWVLSVYSPGMSRFFKLTLVVLMTATLGVQALAGDTPVRENYRDAAKYLEENASYRDVIVLSAPFTVFPFEYYYNGHTQISTVPIWNPYQEDPIPPFSIEGLPEDLEMIKGSHQNLWLLLSFDQGYEEDLRLYMDQNYQRTESVQFSPGLTLYAYKLRYDI
jgi:mannosyltransferase